MSIMATQALGIRRRCRAQRPLTLLSIVQGSLRGNFLLLMDGRAVGLICVTKSMLFACNGTQPTRYTNAMPR